VSILTGFNFATNFVDMLVIYGLGNNDSKYLDTKHNIGRICLENIASQLSLSFQKRDTFAFAKTQVGDDILYLVYSLGYMNNSGEPLASFASYFKLDFTTENINLLILQDDSDQLETKVKLLQAGGSAGHHGINSIYRNVLGMRLSQEKIWRLKIGIRPIQNTARSETFVLQKLSQNELKFAKTLSQKVYQYLPNLVKSSFEKVQSDLNQNLTLDKI
jgi:PTH1 family peptidyl-tRNA hydrolase